MTADIKKEQAEAIVKINQQNSEIMNYSIIVEGGGSGGAGGVGGSDGGVSSYQFPAKESRADKCIIEIFRGIIMFIMACSSNDIPYMQNLIQGKSFFMYWVCMIQICIVTQLLQLLIIRSIRKLYKD